MRRILVRTVSVACLAGLAACASKTTPPPAPVVASDVQESPGKLSAQQAVTVTATVKDIDQKTRMVTLLGPDGQEIEFRADDEVRNLAQVKRGDHVQATYYESLVIQVMKPGTAKPGIQTASDADRAKLGAMPGGAAAESTRVVATVVSVDKKKSTVTLKGPQGNLRTLPVKNPMHLDAVKAGDLVEVTYTQAVGIAVATPAK
jgi:Cu/Ag efflux protein CusF